MSIIEIEVKSNAERDLKKIENQAKKTDDSFEDLEKQIGNLDKELEKITDLTKKYTSANSNLAGEIKNLAGAYLTFETAKDVVGKLLDSYRTLEAKTYDIVKTTGLSKNEVEELTKSFDELATKTTGYNLKGLYEIAGIAGQLGIKGKENIQQFTKAIAQLESTSTLSAEEAGTAMAQLSNQLGEPIKNIEKLTSAITYLASNTTATESDVIYYTSRISAMGKTFGLTSSEILGFASTLKDVGINAELGGTAISDVMANLLMNTQKVTKVLGLDFDEFSKKIKDKPVEALRTLIVELGKFDKASKVKVLKDLGFAGTGTAQTLLKLSDNIKVLDKNLKVASEGYRTANKTQKEFEASSGSLDKRIQQLDNKVQVLGKEFGTALRPEINKVLDIFDYLIEAIGRNQEEIITITKYVGGLTTAFVLLNKVIKASPIGATVTGLTTLAGVMANVYNLEKQRSELAKEWDAGAKAREEIKATKELNESKKTYQKNLEQIKKFQDLIAKSNNSEKAINAYKRAIENLENNNKELQKKIALLDKTTKASEKVEKAEKKIQEATKATAEEIKKQTEVKKVYHSTSSKAGKEEKQRQKEILKAHQDKLSALKEYYTLTKEYDKAFQIDLQQKLDGLKQMGLSTKELLEIEKKLIEERKKAGNIKYYELMGEAQKVFKYQLSKTLDELRSYGLEAEKIAQVEKYIIEQRQTAIQKELYNDLDDRLNALKIEMKERLDYYKKLGAKEKELAKIRAKYQKEIQKEELKHIDTIEKLYKNIFKYFKTNMGDLLQQLGGAIREAGSVSGGVQVVGEQVASQAKSVAYSSGNPYLVAGAFVTDLLSASLSEQNTYLEDLNLGSKSISNTLENLKNIMNPHLRYTKSILKNTALMAKGLDKSGNIIASNKFATGEDYTPTFTSFADNGAVKGVTGFLEDIPAIGKLAGGLLSGLASGLYSKSKSLESAGIEFANQSVGNFIENVNAQAYQLIKIQKKAAFGLIKSTSYEKQYQALDSNLKKQFSKIIEAGYNTVITASKVIGTKKIKNLEESLKNITIDIGSLSTKGLSAEQIKEKLSSAFSTQLDKIARKANGQIIQKFEKVGEGGYEALIRIATSYEQANYELKKIGVNTLDLANITKESDDLFTDIIRQSIVAKESIGGSVSGIGEIIKTLNASSTDLIDTYKVLIDVQSVYQKIVGTTVELSADMIYYAGGLEKLNSLQNSYFNNYLTEQDRISVKTKEIAKVFNNLGLTVPKTKEEFKALVEEVGKSNKKTYIDLLKISGIFADVVNYNEKIAKIEKDKADKRIKEIEQLDKKFTDNFSSPQEKLKALEDELNKAFDSLGLEFPTSIDDYKQKVLQSRDVREENPEYYYQILAVQDSIKAYYELKNKLTEEELRLTGKLIDTTKANIEQIRGKYEELFLSDSEKFDNLKNKLTKVFEKYNYSLPQSVEAYKNIIDHFNIATTEEIGKFKNKILNLAENSNIDFDKYKNVVQNIDLISKKEIDRYSNLLQNIDLTKKADRELFDSMIENIKFATQADKEKYVELVGVAGDFKKYIEEINKENNKALEETKKRIEDINNFRATFEDLFYSDEEKLAKLQNKLSASFASLGIEKIPTRAEYRQLVESYKIIYGETSEQYKKILSLASDFNSLTEKTNADSGLKSFKDKLSNFIDNIRNLGDRISGTITDLERSDSRFEKTNIVRSLIEYNKNKQALEQELSKGTEANSDIVNSLYTKLENQARYVYQNQYTSDAIRDSLLGSLRDLQNQTFQTEKKTKVEGIDEIRTELGKATYIAGNTANETRQMRKKIIEILDYLEVHKVGQQ